MEPDTWCLSKGGRGLRPHAAVFRRSARPIDAGRRPSGSARNPEV